jgi:hypothetical protein
MLTAEQAIDKIKSETIVFMGRRVRRYNYTAQIRDELQQMAEDGVIAPAEYWQTLRITYPKMTAAERRSEHDIHA